MSLQGAPAPLHPLPLLWAARPWRVRHVHLTRAGQARQPPPLHHRETGVRQLGSDVWHPLLSARLEPPASPRQPDTGRDHPGSSQEHVTLCRRTNKTLQINLKTAPAGLDGAWLPLCFCQRGEVVHLGVVWKPCWDEVLHSRQDHQTLSPSVHAACYTLLVFVHNWALTRGIRGDTNWSRMSLLEKISRQDSPMMQKYNIKIPEM